MVLLCIPGSPVATHGIPAKDMHNKLIMVVVLTIDRRGGRGLETELRTVHIPRSDVTSVKLAAF